MAVTNLNTNYILNGDADLDQLESLLTDLLYINSLTNILRTCDLPITDKDSEIVDYVHCVKTLNRLTNELKVKFNQFVDDSYEAKKDQS